jgi:putative FmdB family regulatory protein
MPLYTFQCTSCTKEFDVIVQMGTKEAKCSCGSKAKKVMALSNFHLKGGGWEKDGYSSSGK